LPYRRSSHPGLPLNEPAGVLHRSHIPTAWRSCDVPPLTKIPNRPSIALMKSAVNWTKRCPSWTACQREELGGTSSPRAPCGRARPSPGCSGSLVGTCATISRAGSKEQPTIRPRSVAETLSEVETAIAVSTDMPGRASIVFGSLALKRTHFSRHVMSDPMTAAPKVCPITRLRLNNDAAVVPCWGATSRIA